MDYVINFSDPAKPPFIVKPYTVDGPMVPPVAAAHTSLILVGKGKAEYGELVQEGLVHLLEHFANDVAPPFPVEGQIWYKNTTSELFIYDGTLWRGIPISGTGSVQIFHNTHPSYFNSFLRKSLIDSSNWANSSLNECLETIDKELHRLNARNRRKLIENQTFAISGITTGLPGSFTIPNTDVTELFKFGFSFVFTSNPGIADGTYSVSSSTFDGINTIVVPAEAIPAGAPALGNIDLLTYEVPWFVPEKGELIVSLNGVKQYRTERGFNIISIPTSPNVINLGNWCGLPNGTYSFDIAFDGSSANTISIPVNQTDYTIVGNVITANTWIISGNNAAAFNPNSELIVVNNVGLGLSNITKYTVKSSTQDGTNTFIEVNETISPAADATGEINVAFTINDLVKEINNQIASLATSTTIRGNIVVLNNSGYCVYENGGLTIFSNFSGISSAVGIADIDLFTTMDTNLSTTSPISFTPSNPITRTYGYREFGIPLTGMSNIINLNQPLLTNSVMEIFTIK